MTLPDLFALVVLLVLVLAAFAVWVVIAMLPGRIAAQRNHPQAEAINVCGWWGAITLGILTPLAFIWAYTNPTGPGPRDGTSAAADDSVKETME